MSIIYDALKKVEEKFSDVEEKKIETQKSKPKTYLVYLSIIILGVLSVNLFYNFLIPTNKIILRESTVPSSLLSPEREKNIPPELSKDVNSEKNDLPLTEEPPKTNSLNEESLPLLILNGIFFSKNDNDSYALINNQILREGDSIEGLLVKKISSREVELQNLQNKDSSSFKLSTK